LIEAESEAKANAAMLEAQALDIKMLNSARYPEILEYRFRQETLNKLEAIAENLPQIINVGPPDDNKVNFMAVAQQMMGVQEMPLYSQEDIEAIRRKMDLIQGRIRERSRQIKQISIEAEAETPKTLQAAVADIGADEDVKMGGQN
jgi:hypothetical protein